MPAPERSNGALIAIAIVALAVCSVPVFGTRFLNDMEFYSLFADKVLSGQLLYRDALDTKPPLIFVHYALIFKFFGLNNIIAVKLVTMGWLALSAVAIVGLRRALAPATAAPLLAAPLFILASFCGWGEDFLSSNTELLANLFILVGAWLLVSRDFSAHPVRLALAGVSLGIACLYRYHSGAAFVAYVATVLLRYRQFDRRIVRILWVGIGFSLPLVVFVAYYARLGALGDLWLMLKLQALYAHDSDPFSWRQLLGRAFVATCGLWPLLFLAVLQFGVILRKWADASRADVFQLMFAIFSVAGFFAGGRLFPHYFVQAIPALVLLTTERLACQNTGREPGRTSVVTWFQRYALHTMAVIAAVFTVTNAFYYWTGKPPAPSRDVVAYVNVNTSASDEVLLWAWRPQILFDTGRVFATRLLVNSPLIGQLEPPPPVARPRVRRPGLPELWPAFLADLSAKPPKIIIDDPPGQSDWRMEGYPQFASLLANYRPCQLLDDLCVYLRKE